MAYGAIVKAQYGARASLGIGVGTVRREAGYRRASTKQGFNFFGDIGFNRSSLFLSQHVRQSRLIYPAWWETYASASE